MQRAGFTKAAAVVQSDTVNLAPGFTVKALYVSGAAAVDVKVRTVNGDAVTFKTVQPGTILPVAIVRVYDTGTTAADADMLVLGD